MPPLIVEQPWPPDVGENLRHPNGQLVMCPTSGRPLRAYHDQIFLWATFTADRRTRPTATAPLFPILLDTGLNEPFLMQQRQAETWMTPAVFTTFQTTGSHIQFGQERILAWDIALWVFPNVVGTRTPDPSGNPVHLRIPSGVVLTPPGSAYTKEKPLLGLRAIRVNNLLLRFDGLRGSVSLDTP
jgi:hypothetical protein